MYESVWEDKGDSNETRVEPQSLAAQSELQTETLNEILNELKTLNNNFTELNKKFKKLNNGMQPSNNFLTDILEDFDWEKGLQTFETIMGLFSQKSVDKNGDNTDK